MEIRTTILQLANTVDDVQRAHLETTLPAKAWGAFLHLEEQARHEEDEDEVKLAVVKFGMALPDPQALREALSEEQRSLVDQLEEAMRAELGL